MVIFSLDISVYEQVNTRKKRNDECCNIGLIVENIDSVLIAVGLKSIILYLN